MKSKIVFSGLIILIVISCTLTCVKSCEGHEHDHQLDHQHNQESQNNQDHSHDEQQHQKDIKIKTDFNESNVGYTHDEEVKPSADSYLKPHKGYLMISQKQDLLQSLKRSKIGVFFYGQTNTQQYQQFQQMLLTKDEQNSKLFSSSMEFYFIPSNKFKLVRANPSLSIYRNIRKGEWLIYQGIYDQQQMQDWIYKNSVDPLKDLTVQQVQEIFIQAKKAFILLDFGQFDLLKTKIMLDNFCAKYLITCGKVTHHNKALHMTIQLMRVENQPGVPKLGYWNPQTKQLQLYTKDPSEVTQNQLMQLYSGHESVIPFETEMDVAKVIHPDTLIIRDVDSNSQL